MPWREPSLNIRRESIVVFVLGLALFTLGLWRQPFIDFESRFAVFAQEMWRHGISLFPTTYGEPYPDYPVTGTLLIWLCSHLFGGVTKLSAVLPTAIAAALNLAILYRLLAPYSRRWAAMALCLQIMTATFIAEARSISLDQLLATITLFGFYCVYRARENHRDFSLLKFAALLIAGFAVRGPLGVVIPAAVVIGFYAVDRQWRDLMRFGVVALAVLIVAWAGLLFAAAKIYGNDFMRDVIRMQVVGRLEKHDALPWFYYFTSSFGNYALAYPLAIVALIVAAPTLWRESRTPELRLLLLFVAWFAIVVVGLSIPQGKKARYLLPVVPALAAIAAYPWSQIISNKVFALYKSALEKLLFVLPSLLIAALVFGRNYAARNDLDLPAYLPAIFVALIAVQAAALVIQWRVSPSRRTPLFALLSMLAMWMSLAFVVEPVRTRAHDTHAFVAHVEAERARRPAALVLLDMAKDGEAIKYIVNVDADIRPVFAGTAEALETIARPYYVVVSDGDLARLKPDMLNDETRIVHERFNGHPFSAFYVP